MAAATPNVLSSRTRVLVASADSGFRKRLMTNPMYASAWREEVTGGAHALARLGVSWNYMPSFIDVFEYHHAPERAQHDPYLVGIVAAADQFLIGQASPVDSHSVDAPAIEENVAEPSAAPESAASGPLRLPQQVMPSFLERCLPELSESECHAVMEMLQTEYLHLLPLVQLGMAVAASDV
jgi:hypothetical protein